MWTSFNLVICYAIVPFSLSVGGGIVRCFRISLYISHVMKDKEHEFRGEDKEEEEQIELDTINFLAAEKGSGGRQVVDDFNCPPS